MCDYDNVGDYFTIIKKISNHRVIKFLCVGLLNTVFGYSIYAALVYVGIHYSLALLIATILGVIFNYFSFGRILFQGRGGLIILGKFVTAYGAVYFFNVFFLGILTNNVEISPYVAQVICVFPTIFLNWLLMNYYVYKRSYCATR